MLLISDMKWMAKAEFQMIAFPCHLKGTRLLVWCIVCFSWHDFLLNEKEGVVRPMDI